MRNSAAAPRRTGRHGLGGPLSWCVDVWRQRSLLIRLVNQDIAARYGDSVLGSIWVVAQPLLSLAVYSLVFLVVFAPRSSARDMTPTAYVLELFCGIVLFGVFAESTLRAPLMITSKPGLVKKVVFPVELLPASAFGTAAVLGAPGLVLLVVGVLVAEGRVSPTIWLLPAAVAPLVPLSLGLAWFLASLGVYLRDTQHVVRALVQLGFFLTPVVWSIDLLPQPWMRTIAMANPLAVVVESSREALIRGGTLPWDWLGGATVFALVVCVAGRWWFERTRGGFGDVL